MAWNSFDRLERSLDDMLSFADVRMAIRVTRLLCGLVPLITLVDAWCPSSNTLGKTVPSPQLVVFIVSVFAILAVIAPRIYRKASYQGNAVLPFLLLASLAISLGANHILQLDSVAHIALDTIARPCVVVGLCARTGLEATTYMFVEVLMFMSHGTFGSGMQLRRQALQGIFLLVIALERSMIFLVLRDIQNCRVSLLTSLSQLEKVTSHEKLFPRYARTSKLSRPRRRRRVAAKYTPVLEAEDVLVPEVWNVAFQEHEENLSRLNRYSSGLHVPLGGASCCFFVTAVMDAVQHGGCPEGVPTGILFVSIVALTCWGTGKYTPDMMDRPTLGILLLAFLYAYNFFMKDQDHQPPLRVLVYMELAPLFIGGLCARNIKEATALLVAHLWMMLQLNIEWKHDLCLQLVCLDAVVLFMAWLNGLLLQGLNDLGLVRKLSKAAQTHTATTARVKRCSHVKAKPPQICGTPSASLKASLHPECCDVSGFSNNEFVYLHLLDSRCLLMISIQEPYWEIAGVSRLFVQRFGPVQCGTRLQTLIPCNKDRDLITTLLELTFDGSALSGMQRCPFTLCMPAGTWGHMIAHVRTRAEEPIPHLPLELVEIESEASSSSSSSPRHFSVPSVSKSRHGSTSTNDSLAEINSGF